MTKVKLKEATKELNQKAGAILEESARIRRNAEALLQSLQKQRAQKQREEEEARKRLQAEQHTKAWTMPDDEEGTVPAAAPAEAEKPEAEAAPAPEKEAPAAVEAVAEKKEAARRVPVWGSVRRSAIPCAGLN